MVVPVLPWSVGFRWVPNGGPLYHLFEYAGCEVRVAGGKAVKLADMLNAYQLMIRVTLLKFNI